MLTDEHRPASSDDKRLLRHTDPAFTLRVYSHMMRRSDEEREERNALGGGPGFWDHF